MRKPWMWTIHGLHCSSMEPRLCGQSIDACSICRSCRMKGTAEHEFRQSSDTDIRQAVSASRSCRHKAIQLPITAKSGSSFSERKVGKILPEDGSLFKLVQTVTPS